MVVFFAAHALALAIDEEFHLIGIVVIAPQIHGLSFRPVPMREEMEHRLVGPLTLIHVITVFREAGKVDDAEVTAASREAVRCWLTDIIPACPDELSGTIGRVFHHDSSCVAPHGTRQLS